MTKSEINFIYQLKKYSPVGNIQNRIPRKKKKASKLEIKKHFNRIRKKHNEKFNSKSKM